MASPASRVPSSGGGKGENQRSASKAIGAGRGLHVIRYVERRRCMRHIIAWIVVGIIAGWLARMVVPREGPGGIVGDLIIGIIGALIGGWVFGAFGHAGVTGF